MRLVLVFVLLVGACLLALRHAQGHRHSVVIAVLLVPGLVLGWYEYEDRRSDQRMSAAASVLAGRPVTVDCQRFGAAMLDGGAELGRVAFDASGRPEDSTTITYDACQDLHAWMGSDKRRPSLDQVVAVHVLAHEAEHLAGITSEAEAECRSVQTTERTAVLLGATAAQARDLAQTYALQVYPRMPEAYRTPDCRADGPLDATPGDASWP